MKILFFDDDVKRHKQFKKLLTLNLEVTQAFGVGDALELLRKEKFDIVFLDHDMDGQIYQPSGKGTGYEVAQFIANLPDNQKPRRAIVHSFNEYGAPLMVDILNQAGINSEWCLFCSLEFRDEVDRLLISLDLDV